jgi:hypothetical protein
MVASRRSLVRRMMPKRRRRRNDASATFSSMPMSITSPCWRRSSGTGATPADIAASGEPFGKSRPATRTVPVVRRSMPKIARTTSVRPAPTSPASATISPRRTVNEMSLNTPSRARSRTSRTTSPGVVAVLGSSAPSSRPTIDRMMLSMVTSSIGADRTKRPSRMMVRERTQPCRICLLGSRVAETFHFALVEGMLGAPTMSIGGFRFVTKRLSRMALLGRPARQH